jgi:DNA gyrase subunit A
LSRAEVERERDELQETISELTAILEDDALLRRTVSTELADVAKAHTTPRRTVLLEAVGLPVSASASPLEVADEPCHVLLSSTGLIARTTSADALPSDGARAAHDAIVSSVTSTSRAEIGLVTSNGRVVRLPVVDLPALPPTAAAPSLAGGAPLTEFAALDAGERVLALTTLNTESAGLALGTEQGVVKRVVPDVPNNRDAFEVIRLDAGDRVVGAVELQTGEEELVFVTSDAQLLHFPASAVRPQGRPAGGMAGVRLEARQRVVFFGVVDPSNEALVVTVAGSSAALPGTDPGSAKVTPFALYPGKGRATGGVRAQRFLRGEDTLLLAWVGPSPIRAAAANGQPVDVPAVDQRRDGSGSPLQRPVAAVAGPVATPPRE